MRREAKFKREDEAQRDLHPPFNFCLLKFAFCLLFVYCVAQTLTGLKSTTGKDRFSSVYFRPQNFVGAPAGQAVSAVSRLPFYAVAAGRRGRPRLMQVIWHCSEVRR